MPRRECSESRKKRTDGAWLTPKHQNNGRSAGKPRTGEPPETIPYGSRIASDWRFEVVSILIRQLQFREDRRRIVFIG